MNDIEITSMSSRGQIVIPLDIRQELGLNEGEKFFVIGNEDTIILKKVTPPSFKDFDKLIKKTQQFAKENKITKKDLDDAIKTYRKQHSK